LLYIIRLDSINIPPVGELFKKYAHKNKNLSAEAAGRLFGELIRE